MVLCICAQGGKNPPVGTVISLKNADISTMADPVTRSFVEIYFCLNKNIQNLFISSLAAATILL